ncbi:isochorismatase family cysteine hydrolase [Actinomadura sp. HBU206391]|uniref:isochorismatase family cysteine hydrolase n=1 Tax=Actinomadura sp. HBU206391 TaxID=2731692 RepID=UPI00164FEA05|nr:isochorismatase family cysteine hydrolase [Actinomadura sp. HBU206391]MBC6463714.1 cysteine hydrolase [Actinomadura sp. HBU206391]
MKSHPALLMMDLINEIVHPDGKYAGDGYYQQVSERQVLEHAAIALDRARTAGIPVIHVVVGFSGDYAQWPPASPVFAEARADRRLVLGTWATRIHDAVRPLAGEPVVAKHRVSPFYGTPLEEMLHALRVDTLLLTGVTTDLVVLSAAREAHDRDYRVEVLADATATADDALHETALTLLARTATVTTVEQASPWRSASRHASTDRDAGPDQGAVQGMVAQQGAVSNRSR